MEIMSSRTEWGPLLVPSVVSGLNIVVSFRIEPVSLRILALFSSNLSAPDCRNKVKVARQAADGSFGTDKWDETAGVLRCLIQSVSPQVATDNYVENGHVVLFVVLSHLKWPSLITDGPLVVSVSLQVDDGPLTHVFPGIWRHRYLPRFCVLGQL